MNRYLRVPWKLWRKHTRAWLQGWDARAAALARDHVPAWDTPFIAMCVGLIALLVLLLGR